MNFEIINQIMIDAGLAYADCSIDIINNRNPEKHLPTIFIHIKKVNSLFKLEHPDNFFDYDLAEHTQAVFELGYKLYRMLDYLSSKT